MIGVLSSSFTLAYLLAAPLAGFFGIRMRLGQLVGWGIFLFSIGMLISSLGYHLWMLFTGRVLTGFGEAVLSTLGPVMLYEGVFKKKGFRLGWFYLAIPLGSAMGFGLSGILLHQWNIHKILFLPVIPGLLMAMIFLLAKRFSQTVLVTRVPYQSVIDFGKHLFSSLSQQDRSLILLSFYLQTLVTFVLGGMAAWVTFYFIRVKLFPVTTIESLTGVMLLAGGIIGMLGGGFLLDQNLRHRADSSYWKPTMMGLCLSLSGVLVVFWGKSLWFCGFGLLVSISGIFLVFVPLNWVLLSRRGEHSSPVLMGISLLVTHLFGDLLSPVLIGELSARWGLSLAVETALTVPLLLSIFLLFFHRQPVPEHL